MTATSYRQMVGAVALVLWASSLMLPAVTMCPDIVWPGWHVAFVGPLGLIIGQFGWYANPFLLWISLRLLFQYRAGVTGGLICLVLALSSFLWTGIPGFQTPAIICERNIGFYVWIASAVLLAAAAFIEKFLDPAKREMSIEMTQNH